MQHVLTLTTDPLARALAAGHAATAAEALRRAGAAVGETDWLAPDVALDLPFDGIPLGAALAAARAALADRPVDANAQPAVGRRKRVLIADMDSTIITSESLDELAEYAGLKDVIAAITARAMRGELEFEAALTERVAMLKGLAESTIDAVLARIEITAGAAALVATMKAHGAYCALVSGGFTPVTGAIRARLGFDEDRANRLEIDEGALTGRVILPILGRDAKLAALREVTGRQGTDPADAVAVGDGANDLAMLQAAGIGVAFRAKPAVREAAGFRIDHGDLSGLLYLQGYRESDIEAALGSPVS
ncbi:MAG: phosphoserine phosphatase SerB [Thalassobaculum sp.]|uniref:phosphoserine phosphatase SerB n=1 Tax=Thalassobaculum sp. TaxID=2022740 RepID=UPI0032EBEB02